MATAVSAISESKKKWDGFKETAEKMKEELRQNIQSLMETIEEVGEVCKKFHEEYCGKIPSKSKEMMQLQSDLKQMVIKLEKELKKVLSEDVAILFVGRTSSGKSSLINALLQDRRLPVSKVQTTMCKIQVRPTTDKEWSVVKIGCEKPLSDQKSKEDVKALLSKMSGKSKTEERKKLTINSQSVIQVNWPRHLCTLPENIVLIDTAGFKEDHDGDKVILESCEKADILVAVMDCMSPSIKDVRKCIRYFFIAPGMFN